MQIKFHTKAILFQDLIWAKNSIIQSGEQISGSAEALPRFNYAERVNLSVFKIPLYQTAVARL